MSMTEAVSNQFEPYRVIEIVGTIDVAHVWQCKRCLRELSYVRYHPDNSPISYGVDVGQELRDHLQFDCHAKLCGCGHNDRDHTRVSALGGLSACVECRCVRYNGP